MPGHAADGGFPGQFLAFLATDLERHPERLTLVDSALAARLESLVGDVEIDLDAPLPADDA